MKKLEVGIVGFGNFGQFFAKKLATAFDVSVWDCRDFSDEVDKMSVKWATLKQVADKEVVVLAVPLQSMEALFGQLALCLSPNALVMDVCSVKIEPIRLMRKYLPYSDFLGTHPLFGPQSAKDGWYGHRLVICPVTAPSIKSELMLQFFRDQGLRLIELSAEEHDRQMASVQALTHFIARGLAGCEVSNSELSTTAFGHLFKVVELLGADSWELFKTIELGNPFAADIRQKFIQELENLERRLKQD